MAALYDDIGVGYARTRRPDPRIAAQIRRALGDAGPVVNVGAGAGSYEPDDVDVVAIEPAPTMLAQRPPHAAPAVRGVAEALPFADGAFAAGLASLTVHHWSDIQGGLRELRRVVRGRVVVFTWDQRVADRYWMMADYLPESRALDANLPPPEEIAAGLGGGAIEFVPVARDCTDGFYAAWWCRPEAYLDPSVRAAISGIARLDPAVVDAAVARLAHDLDTGAWHQRHGGLLELDEYDAGYRLVVSTVSS